MTILRIPAALALAASLLVASPALAQAPAGETDQPSRLLGIRAEAGISGGFGTVVSARSEDTFVSSGSYGNIRLGYDFPIGITALLRLGYAGASTTTTPENNARAEAGSSGSIFALGLEGRYYFMREKRTRPFAFGDFTKTFVSLGETTGGDSQREDQHNLDADQADTFGFSFGAGAEHGFTRQFAVGGKWGLDFSFRGYEDRDADIQGSSNQIGTSAELYAAFRF